MDKNKSEYEKFKEWVEEFQKELDANPDADAFIMDVQGTGEIKPLFTDHHSIHHYQPNVLWAPFEEFPADYEAELADWARRRSAGLPHGYVQGTEPGTLQVMRDGEWETLGELVSAAGTDITARGGFGVERKISFELVEPFSVTEEYVKLRVVLADEIWELGGVVLWQDGVWLEIQQDTAVMEKDRGMRDEYAGLLKHLGHGLYVEAVTHKAAVQFVCDDCKEVVLEVGADVEHQGEPVVILDKQGAKVLETWDGGGAVLTLAVEALVAQYGCDKVAEQVALLNAEKTMRQVAAEEETKHD